MTSLAPLAVVASVAPASTTRARVAVARPARAMVTSTPRAKISVSSSSSSRRARVVAASSSSSPSDASASSDAADANAASAQLWIDAWREKYEKRVAKAARKEDKARAKEAETILREQLDAVGADYAKMLDGFLNLLPLQTHVDLKFLLFRLDFSEYYCKQKIGPSPGSLPF